jgi:exopolysaccharide production protein ExoQ
MVQSIGIAAAAALILWLFHLLREPGERTSPALWIPVAWMLIVGSRAVSEWNDVSSSAATAEQYQEGTPLDAAIFLLLILAGMLVLNSRARLVNRFLHGNLPVLAFFAFCAVSLAWSDYPFVALKHWFKAIGDLTMVLVVLTDPHPLAATRRFFARAAIFLLPLSVMLIFCFPGLGSSYDPTDGVTYFSGVTTQKNELGLICLVFSLSSLWSILGLYGDRSTPLRRRQRQTLGYGILLLLAVWLIVKADSMTAMSCLLLTGTAMVLATQRWVARKGGYVHLVAGCAVGLALFAAFIDTSGALLRLLGRNPTLTGRSEIWKAVLSLHTDPLIGTGYDSFWLGDRMKRVWEIINYKGISQAHNGYIEIYINMGWIGLAFLAALLVSGYGRAATALRRDPHLGRLKLGFVVVSAMYSLSEAGFRKLNPLWIALLLAIVEIPAAVGASRPAMAANPLAPELAVRQTRILR